MKTKWTSYVTGVSKELRLIFSIVASAGAFTYFIGGQRLILTFYNIPTFFAAYYLGRRRAVEAALGSILFVTWVDLMNPTILGKQTFEMDGWLTWSDLTIWAGLLLIFSLCRGNAARTRRA